MKQKDYFVQWEIDISAKSPREAAKKALEIQRDLESTATVFHVYDDGGESGDYFLIDLEAK